MQVAFSNVFGPLKDHPSQAVPRAGGDDMLGVIEMRHEPNEPGTVRLDGQLLVAVAAVALRPLLQRPAQPRRCAARGRGPAGRRPDRLRRRHRALRRDLARGARPDRGRDRDLRDGRDHGEPPVRPARRISSRSRRGAQAVAVMTEFEGRPRALHPAVWTRSSGQKVLHVSPWMAKGIEGREDPDGDALLAAVCDEIVDGRRRTSATSTAGSRPTWSSGTTGVASTRCRACRPTDARCMHRTTIEGDYGLGRFEAEPPSRSQ